MSNLFYTNLEGVFDCFVLYSLLLCSLDMKTFSRFFLTFCIIYYKIISLCFSFLRSKLAHLKWISFFSYPFKMLSKPSVLTNSKYRKRLLASPKSYGNLPTDLKHFFYNLRNFSTMHYPSGTKWFVMKPFLLSKSSSTVRNHD